MILLITVINHYTCDLNQPKGIQTADSETFHTRNKAHGAALLVLTIMQRKGRKKIEKQPGQRRLEMIEYLYYECKLVESNCKVG